MNKSTYYLIHINHPSKKFSLKKDSLIGSNINCNISLTENEIADKHCKIRVQEFGFLVRSLNPDKLVKINNIPIYEAVASPGDRIEFNSSEVYEIRSLKNINCRDFILKSKNKTWHNQLRQIDAISQSNEPVLILGPSGTGKEEIARIIHEKSSRRHKPIICVNCSALSESLIESELFGHKKGSFTGAIADRKGAFVSASGGTLFLDEIGDLPIELQPKLLRALENKEIRPVGSDQTVQTDVRIIAATHQSLENKIKDADFREDLFFRLNILRLTPPSLLSRMEDFEDLLLFFCQKEGLKLKPKIIKLLKNHIWPGNIRELKNFVTRAAALYKDKEILGPDLLNLLDNIDPRTILDPHFTQFDARGITMKEAEVKLITKCLMLNNGNQRKTAIQLGMPKSTLSDKIKNYNIDVLDIKKKSRQLLKGV